VGAARAGGEREHEHERRRPASRTTKSVVRLGGVEVEVHHFGRSHTSGDSVVYHPDLKVVALTGFLPVEYGQRGPTGTGMALEVRSGERATVRLAVADERDRGPRG
jgi:glyoxylase-like metal-dependent hydrolase (beta-lactamase superfamily II)